MDLANNEIFKLGVEAGRKQMMDHIQHQCSKNKPIEANGELYWLTDSRQHLLEIMDGIDREYDIQDENQYIVPMHKVFDGKCMEFKLLITAKTPYEAWCIAYAAFEFREEGMKDGWKVFREYDKYKQLK